MTDVAHAHRVAGVGGYALPVAALVVAAASVSVAAANSAAHTTYASTSTAAAVIDTAAGLGLLAAGVFTHAARPRGSVGPLAALLGVAWLAGDWVGWEGGSPVARSVAMVAALFVLPLVAHLALAFPAGRVTDRWARLFLAIGYGVTATVSLGRALFRDPFLDQYCWTNCTDNVFLLRADQDVSRLLEGLGLRAAVVVGAATAGACVWRLARATPVARKSTWFVLIPASGAALAIMAYALLLLRNPAENPEQGDFAAAFMVRAATLAALAAGVGWGVLRTIRTRRETTRLTEALGTTPSPGSLRTALARSLGDESLQVAYWLPSDQRYVDASGQTVELSPGPRQAATQIVRAGVPVAVVVHDQALSVERDLEQEIGAAARLAVDNERLRAEILAQLDDLQASRARIVDTADATRRRLERDLHDGAQQRLLAASFELRLAHHAAMQAGDSELADTLAKLGADVEIAISDLRDLAHGIFPAILTESGLDAALRSIAVQAPIAVELDDVVTKRYSAAVETTAYLVVAATIEECSRSASTFLAVRIAEDGDRLVVELHTDADQKSPRLRQDQDDRVGALGGQLMVGPDYLRAEIPCVP